MTALGVIVMAAGVALVWGGITDRPILPELRAALGNTKPGGKGATSTAAFNKGRGK